MGLPKNMDGTEGPRAGSSDLIGAKEQEVVGKGDDGEQIAGEGQKQEVHQHQNQVKETKEPCFHGNDKEKQETGIRVHGGKGQEEAGVQIGNTGLGSEDHAVDIHQDHAGKIEKIKPEGTPAVLDGPAEGVVDEQGDTNQQEISVSNAVGQRISEQPPYLTAQNEAAIKGKNVVKTIIVVDLGQKVNNGGSDADIEHQIGNAFVPIGVAPAFKPGAQIFQ